MQQKGLVISVKCLLNIAIYMYICRERERERELGGFGYQRDAEEMLMDHRSGAAICRSVCICVILDRGLDWGSLLRLCRHRLQYNELFVDSSFVFRMAVPTNGSHVVATCFQLFYDPA